MTRLLNANEIEFILDFITPPIGINHNSAVSICNYRKRKLTNQLEQVYVKPEIILSLKKEIKDQYNKTLIHPGESVGIICAQSIGEKNTQTALNTFHKAGQSEKTMTEGVPRFEELLNATKNPKITNHKVFYTTNNTSIKQIRTVVGKHIQHITFNDLVTNVELCLNKTEEPFYNIFKNVHNSRFASYKHCLRFTLDLKKLYRFRLTLLFISNCIENNFQDTCCVFPPLGCDFIDVFIDTSQVHQYTQEYEFNNVSEEYAIEIYLYDCVIPELKKTYISGVKGVDEIFFTKDENISEWLIETNCYSSQHNMLKSLLSIPDVDVHKTFSNNVWELYEIFGIEASKNFLIQEFMNIMSGINSCHAILLVDRMTRDGYIQSISRYTLKNDSSGPLAKASFEECLDNFLNASIKGEVDPVMGVSASIICGKRAKCGTGIMELKIDTKFFF